MKLKNKGEQVGEENGIKLVTNHKQNWRNWWIAIQSRSKWASTERTQTCTQAILISISWQTQKKNRSHQRTNQSKWWPKQQRQTKLTFQSELQLKKEVMSKMCVCSMVGWLVGSCWSKAMGSDLLQKSQKLIKLMWTACDDQSEKKAFFKIRSLLSSVIKKRDLSRACWLASLWVFFRKRGKKEVALVALETKNGQSDPSWNSAVAPAHYILIPRRRPPCFFVFFIVVFLSSWGASQQGKWRPHEGADEIAKLLQPKKWLQSFLTHR